MVFREFNNVATTAFRPNYLRDEARQFGRYGAKGNVRYEYSLDGPLHTRPTHFFRKATNEALERTALYGKGIVQPDTPVDTGLLRSRWYAKAVRWDEWRLSNDIFYGPFQEKRTQMLYKNLPKIQKRLGVELDRAIPRYLN